MTLIYLPLDRLSVSKTNMRYAKKAPDVSDILPTVRRRGVIQTLLVRPCAAPDGADGDHYEIVAGARRFHAAALVAAETGEGEPLPCRVLAEGDDAAAIEASIIENVARRDPDEVQQWESFVRLVREGRSVADIAATFDLPELGVKRILALGNLSPRIRDLYRSEAIDRVTVRHLTMASKSQQKAWLALHGSKEAYCPTGHQLKSWLFGGASISVGHALFDLDSYAGAVVADLFGEGGYFADAESFWAAQRAAIEARRDAYLADGWSDVVLLDAGSYFHSWEYERAGKRKGGRVYVEQRASGEISFHEGYVTAKEARALARGKTPEQARKAPRPEISSTLQTYVDLHRHAAVRADLLGRPGLALRLLVAHAIGGSHLWRVSPDPRTIRAEAIADSIESSSAEAAFDTARRAVLAVLGADADSPTVTGGNGDDWSVATLFARLIELPDPVVLEIVAVVIGETLASGSAVVEALGIELGTDMARHWQADDALFESLRDREVLLAMVAEVAGDTVAVANRQEKGKTLKAIIRAHLDGTNGRPKVENWVPRWMAFPPSAYTNRGGVGTVQAYAKIATPDPDPVPEPLPLAA